MVELVNQRERPRLRRRSERVTHRRPHQREHRVAGRRRRRHRVAAIDIAQRNAARRQPAPATSQRLSINRIAQRLVRARLEQRRHRAGRNRGLPATSPVPPPCRRHRRPRCLQQRRPRQPSRSTSRRRNRRVVVNRDHQAGGIADHRVAVKVGRLNDRTEIDRQIVLSIARRMVELVNQRERPRSRRRGQRNVNTVLPAGAVAVTVSAAIA